MAIKKAQVITVTSAKGGAGKTTLSLCLAGIYGAMNKKVLVIDLDVYTGVVAATLNVDDDSNIFKLVKDLNDNKFTNIDDYTSKYNDNIDIIASVKDPRFANKIVPNHLQTALDKFIHHYDIIIIDTTKELSLVNILAFDKSDVLLYIINNSIMDLKNMANMVSIFKDMGINNYKILLNESRTLEKGKLSKNEMQTIIKDKIAYYITNDFHIKDFDRYIMHSKILTLDEDILKKYKKEIANLNFIARDMLDNLDDKVKEEK